MATKRKIRGLGLVAAEHDAEASRALATVRRHLQMKGPFSCPAAQDYVVEIAETLGTAKAHMHSGHPASEDKRDLHHAEAAFKSFKKAFRNTCVRGVKSFELAGLRRRKAKR